MKGNASDVPRLEAPEGRLEQAFVDEFLRARGYDSATLRALPEDERNRLQTEASVYAAGKLAEVEARSHFIHEIHSDE